MRLCTSFSKGHDTLAVAIYKTKVIDINLGKIYKYPFNSKSPRKKKVHLFEHNIFKYDTCCRRDHIWDFKLLNYIFLIGGDIINNNYDYNLFIT